MSAEQLFILFNEACRQRAIATYHNAVSFDGKASKQMLERAESVHGQYTEGFYEAELERLGDFLKGK